MPQAVSFTGYTPAARYDAISWSEARIEEAATETGTFTQIDVIAFASVIPSGADPDPADPLARSFTTQLGGDDEGLWYRIVFADTDGTTSVATSPVQNIDDDVAVVVYADVTELARILKIRTATAEQTAALTRCLRSAALEIAKELDLTSSLSGVEELALAEQVNLDRAADVWHHTESRTGLTGILGGDESIPMPGRYSWERYAQRLVPLKQQWGLA